MTLIKEESGGADNLYYLQPTILFSMYSSQIIQVYYVFSLNFAHLREHKSLRWAGFNTGR